MMMPLLISAFLAALTALTAASPFPQGGTITRQPPKWRLNPYLEYTSYCTSTSTRLWTQEAIPTPPPDVITVTRYRKVTKKLVHKAVDCGPCAYIDVVERVTDFDHPHPGYIGPTDFKYVTKTLKTTITFTHVHCSGWKVPPPRMQDAKKKKRELGAGGDEMMEYVDFDNDAGVITQGGEDCTARVLQVPKLNIGPTRTIFTTTTTTDRIVNCGTCTNHSPIPIPLGVPPVAVFTTTVTAVEPYTETELVCGTSTATSPSSAKSASTATTTASAPYTLTKESIVTVTVTRASAESLAATAPAATTAFQAAVQSIVSHTDNPFGTILPDCVLTYALQAEHQGSTKTVYTSTVTHTKQRVCGQCALVWWSETSEPTVTSFVKTVTKKKPKVETVLVCAEDKPKRAAMS